VAQLVPGGQTGAVDNLSVSQAGFRSQIATAVEGLRQLIGAANIASGSSESTDPLTAPFVLYVNPYIGKDTFASGSYNTKEATGTTEEIVAQKLKRLENQRLTCGYTRHAPFKTINRAVIEAAIITSKNWYISDPLAHVDCVCIVLAPGLHIVYNNPSTDSSAIAVSSWANNFVPTWQHLIKFNPVEGGVLLPRGASIISEFGDLRHTIVRPSWVPDGNVDETPTYSNGVATYALRRQIFKTTGGGYAYAITAMDKLGLAESHHLLSMFGHATQAELNTFYGNVFTACGTGGNLSQALLVARGTEYIIAAPVSGTPTQAWDSTSSASFYIFQCSVRSNFGMGRLWADGSKVQGFKSFVLANFTGVSLQKSISENGDMRCWQKYSGGDWIAVSNYADYISQVPDNIRQNPARRSIGVAAINEGFIQKVSIFDIGEGAQSFVDAGGEIDSNNGNSSFGGVAGLAKGYRASSFPNDKNWQINAVKVPLSPEFKTGNIQRYYLGTVSAITPNAVTLTSALAAYGTSSTIPDILGQAGYTLPASTYLWIENPQGTDWRALVTASAWSSVAPAALNISAAATTPNGFAIGLDTNGISLAVGCRVYVRRLVDTRTPAERRMSLKLVNTTAARIPTSSYVLQTSSTSASIARQLSPTTELLLVTSSGTGDASSGGLKTAEITLRRGGTAINYANNTSYRSGTVVLHNNKHYINSRDLTTSTTAPDPALWQETYVHMESSYAPEDNLKNEALTLVFDTDTDGAEVTATCGINWATAWTTSAAIYSQYRSSVDYLGAFLLLTALGYGSSDAHAALIPRAEASRSRNTALTSNPATSLALSSVSPSGGAANAAANWPIEFRRPSTLWMGSHRWFSSGSGNYSKSVPAAAQDMSAQNRFTYYFTSQGGGRVIPQGSQEDGLLVSPRGLEDTTTGRTLSVESIGAGDVAQSSVFPTLTVTSEFTVDGAANFRGPINFETTQQAQTTRLGPAKLARYTEVIKTGPAASIAINDASIDGSPEIVTVPALNAWKNANQLVSALTGEIFIFVNSEATDRDLNSMKLRPPTSSDDAIPSLARAAEYANYVLAGSEQTAVIKVCPGYYHSGSNWTCKVRLEAWNSTFTAMPFPSNSLGSATVPNNYYDGTGYDNASLIPQILCLRLVLRFGPQAGMTGGSYNLHIANYNNTMVFEKSVKFLGGFAFLGLAETIKYVGVNAAQRAGLFMFSGSPQLTTAQINNLTYSSIVSSNVDAFLSSVRNTTGFTGQFSTWCDYPVIQIKSRATDLIELQDCIFGPGLPSHKENLGGGRPAYIDVSTEVPLEIRNIYLRGNTTITSAGISAGNATAITTALDGSGGYHYGALVPAPWTHRQFYHTFISTMTVNKLNIRALGSYGNYVVRTADAGTISEGVNDWYADLTGKLLPNHIHLLASSTASTAPNSFTPAAGLAYPATGDYDSGPFLDQFIHAKYGISFEWVWLNINGISSTRPVWQGFLGRFGSNGHNTVKTRGILLGNTLGEVEGGCEVTLGNRWQRGSSPFLKAGILDPNTNISVAPFVQGSATYGEANPVVKTNATRSITTRDNNSTTLDLNLGLVSWVRGISPEYGTNIRPANFAA